MRCSRCGNRMNKESTPYTYHSEEGVHSVYYCEYCDMSLERLLDRECIDLKEIILTELVDNGRFAEGLKMAGLDLTDESIIELCEHICKVADTVDWTFSE